MLGTSTWQRRASAAARPRTVTDGRTRTPSSWLARRRPASSQRARRWGATVPRSRSAGGSPAKHRFGLTTGARVEPANVYLGSDIATGHRHFLSTQEQCMKVTVDTRHDSLEEALATVQAAFGSTGNSP